MYLGGTTIPLEVNTVRFVDNFSAGTRGSASAEQFLEAGYAVIFLYRDKSLEPFIRHIDTRQLMTDMSVQSNGDILVSGVSTRLGPIIEKRNMSQAQTGTEVLNTFNAIIQDRGHASKCCLMNQLS